MAKRPSPYRSTSQTFSSSSIPQGEIDLREEFDTLLYGGDGEIRHGFYVLVRHMRRDANGMMEDCSCRDPKTRDGDLDCSYCFGDGTLSDEKWHLTRSDYLGASGGGANRGRFIPPGTIRVDYRVFYFRYDAGLRYGDKIVEVQLDEEGEPVVPYVRIVVYQPRTIDELRADNGRIEYFAVYCREDEAKRQDI